jgi:hypothetical protein
MVVMWLLMSFVIYQGISFWGNSFYVQIWNYIQIGIPFVTLSIIAFLFHMHHVWDDSRILHGSIIGAFGIGAGCVLWVVIGCILLKQEHLIGVGMMSVALLWAFSWVLLFALVGILEDILWAILVVALGSDLWLNLGGSFVALVGHDLGFNFHTITTVNELSIVIGFTLLGIILHFYLNYERICHFENIYYETHKMDNIK